MEDSIEIVTEKLLHVTKDVVVKVPDFCCSLDAICAYLSLVFLFLFQICRFQVKQTNAWI